MSEDWADIKGGEITNRLFKSEADCLEALPIVYRKIIAKALRQARADALEEAACFLDKYVEIVNVPAVVDEIRALKGNRNG